MASCGNSCNASSLALSPTSENDGFLTVAELSRLDVPADAVVLSACETGVGTIESGEGLLGFPSAFLAAGSSSVLVSQWKVDDAATTALMKEVYTRWKAGARLTRALFDAQRHVREQPRWAAPSVWAPWCLWGFPP